MLTTNRLQPSGCSSFSPQIPDVDLIGTASDGEGAVRMAEALSPDVLLLDIEMPGLDGIDVARALASKKPSAAVIFITAFDQFAVAAFEVEAVDYLMKPVTPDRLKRALKRARDHLQRREKAPARPASTSPFLEEFWASDLSGLVRIASRDVDRVSAERDYMRLHVGRRSWLIHHSMNALEEGLDPELFVRLHRSAIVRKDFIAGFTRNPVRPLDRAPVRRCRAAGRTPLHRQGEDDRPPLR